MTTQEQQLAPEAAKGTEPRVAIIDDDKLSSYSLNVKLKFIGEKPVNLSSGTWRKFFKQDDKRKQVCAIIIGKLEGRPVPELVADIHADGLGIPLLLTGGEALMDALDPEFHLSVVGIHERPIHYQALVDSLNKARHRLGMDKKTFQSRIISDTGTAMFRSLVGESPGMQRVRELLRQLEGKLATVLIRGESGTGKEIVARNLHYHCGRSSAPFVAVNCAAASAEQFARELFGFEERGPAGRESQPGHLEKARGGTLFLDVVDEMPMKVQGMLLRFLEHYSFERVGGHETLQSDVRIIAASHAPLEEKIADGGFRGDLFYRLNVVPLDMPPLRERTEDIPALLRELVSRLENHRQGGSIRFNSSATLSLQRHPWPGNVRELANLVERLTIVRGNEVIGVSDLPPEYRHVSEDETSRIEGQTAASAGEAPAEGQTAAFAGIAGLDPLNARSLKEYLANFEKNLIEVALDDCAGRVNLAAERLHTTAQDLEKKMKRHGLMS